MLIFADPDRISQVVTNYVTNALCYSLEDSAAEVGIRMAPQLQV